MAFEKWMGHGGTPRLVVVPAKAGTQWRSRGKRRWIPAYAGMTSWPQRLVNRVTSIVYITALRRLVEIDHDFVGHGIALATQDEPARDLVVLEGEIDVHVDLALD